MTDPQLTRRHFLEVTAAAAGAATLPHGAFAATAAQTAARYTRHNVMSPAGQQALKSYALGVQAMLKLPADHPHNWFRHAFIHLMDCPHENWWFYIWHRAYLGYFEQIIRKLSGDPSFAMPYWDWTTTPRIPTGVFDGALSPVNAPFVPATRTLEVFTNTMQDAMKAYWTSLSGDQRGQLNTRGYAKFANLWNDVTGFDGTNGISGNMCYANPCGARYLTREQPGFDPRTSFMVSELVVYVGLLPTEFHNPESGLLSFTSAKAPSHNTAANGKRVSVLEWGPHNNVHNYVGGVGPLDPGPYGWMTNFLSSVDPIFFLHHSNVDRLWDVWTRKQKALKLPWLPTGDDLASLSNEPFLFYVDADGKFVGKAKAGDYLDMERWGYDYEPGTGEGIIRTAPVVAAAVPLAPRAPLPAAVAANTASVALPAEAIRRHLAPGASPALYAEVTIARPAGGSNRSFDVLVGTPAGATSGGPGSPHYAATIAFFGHMSGMAGMGDDVTFTVPLPKTAQAFGGVTAEAVIAAAAPVTIRVVPARGSGAAPTLKSARVHVP